MERKTEQLNIRLTKSLKLAIECAADDREMTVAQWLTSLAKYELKRLQGSATPKLAPTDGVAPATYMAQKPSRNTETDRFDII